MTTSGLPRRPASLGTISLVLPLLLGLAWFCFGLLDIGLPATTGETASAQSASSIEAATGWILTTATIGLAVAGVALGFLSLRRKEQAKGAATLGIVLNLLILVGCALLARLVHLRG